MIEEILNQYKVVAIVGLSADSSKPSHVVAEYLMINGYDIIPVNPNATEIMGKTCYPNLSSIPQKIEIVDIFRRSEEVLPIVEEAIRTDAKVIWMQEGISNEDAASRARNAGLLVVMDRCIRKEHMRINFDMRRLR